MIHEYADIHETVLYGIGFTCWEMTKIREDVLIGDHVKIGRGCYIDKGIRIGNYCKIQNGAQLYAPCWIDDGVFIGPNAQIINDKKPKARGRDGLRTEMEWQSSAAASVGENASIGAGAIVFPGVIIGRDAMIGAGAVVRHHVDEGETFTG